MLYTVRITIEAWTDLSDLAHFLLHLNPMLFCIIFPHKAHQYAALMNLLLPSKQF